MLLLLLLLLLSTRKGKKVGPTYKRFSTLFSCLYKFVFLSLWKFGLFYTFMSIVLTNTLESGDKRDRFL